MATEKSLDNLLTSLSRDGQDFERLAKWFLENDPAWSATYRRVWLWDEWPQKWGRDCGIDLIAEGFDDRFTAIQAKNYKPASRVTKSDVDRWLSESNRPEIADRLLIASTDLLSPAALSVMEGQEKPVTKCMLADLRDSLVRWPRNAAELGPAAVAPARARAHQVEALDAIDVWAQGDERRGQVIMACGTGKTLVATLAADRLAARRVLVLVPTLDLLHQTAREWSANSERTRPLLLVCGHTHDAEAEELSRGDELATRRTTDPSRIAEALGRPEVLVVCTYHSSPLIAQAMTLASDTEFDLVVADEAHRCAGLEAASHKTILREEAVRARRRLFFTATPTIFGVDDKAKASTMSVSLASMDDTARFGPVVHHLSFGEAVEWRLLTPYRVAVIAVRDSDVQQLIDDRRIVTADGDRNLEAVNLAVQIACARAMRTYDCKRIVAFHRNIPASKRFADHFPIAVELVGEDERPTGALWVKHVDGNGMRPAVRRQRLAYFKTDHEHEYRLLSNVRMLSEGVDVPGIDGVVFVDTNRGHASIIQAVGRAVRPSPGKSEGTIILPIIVRDGETPAQALARSEHRHIVQVLGALRSHDPKITRSLDELRYNVTPGDYRPSGSGRFVVDAPLHVGEDFADAIGVALARALGTRRSAGGSTPRSVSKVFLAEAPKRSEDETLGIGIGIDLYNAGLRQLLAAVPEDYSLLIKPCWEEAKARWSSGTLDDRYKWIIADSVSWLTADLQGHERQRTEMAELTRYGVPAQIAAQFQSGGAYTDGALELISAGLDSADALVQPLTTMHGAITHAGMTPDGQVAAIVDALTALAPSVPAQEVGVFGWEWGAEETTLAALSGLALGLKRQVAKRHGKSSPRRPKFHPDEAQAFDRGLAVARLLVSMVDGALPYRFSGDENIAGKRRAEEQYLHPNERFDELGWEIYLLVLAVGGDETLAAAQALDGTLRARKKVKEDRLRRSKQRFADASAM